MTGQGLVASRTARHPDAVSLVRALLHLLQSLADGEEALEEAVLGQQRLRLEDSRVTGAQVGRGPVDHELGIEGG